MAPPAQQRGAETSHGPEPALLWQRFGLPRDRVPTLLRESERHLRSPEGLLVNRYGYSPLSLEWDLWLDPGAPAELAGANVDHGSPGHLVQQVRALSHTYP